MPLEVMRLVTGNPASAPALAHSVVDFVDFDLVDRIVGVSPCHPQARTGTAVLARTYQRRTPPAVVQGAAPDPD